MSRVRALLAPDVHLGVAGPPGLVGVRGGLIGWSHGGPPGSSSGGGAVPSFGWKLFIEGVAEA